MTTARFLTLDQVAEELATSRAQIYALLKRRDLVGFKIGGRGQWPIERSRLEDYLERTYAETDAWLDKHADEWAGRGVRVQLRSVKARPAREAGGGFIRAGSLT